VRLFTCALTLASVSASAHGLRIAAAATDQGFGGRAFYSDESPVVNERVVLLNAAGETLDKTHTDAAGRFFIAVGQPGQYRLVVTGEEGHRAEAALPFVGTPPASAACADAQALSAAVRRELQPLREDIARYEQRIRLHDVIGGLGFIVGLAGAIALWRSRHANRETG